MQRFWLTLNSLTSRLTFMIVGLLGLMLLLAWINYTQINAVTVQKTNTETAIYTTMGFLRNLQGAVQQTMHHWQDQLLEPKADLDNVRRSVWQNEVNIALDSLENHKNQWGRTSIRKKFEEMRLNMRKFRRVQDDVIKALRDEHEKKIVLEKDLTAARLYQQRGKTLYSTVRINIGEMHNLLNQYHKEEKLSFENQFAQAWFTTALLGFIALAFGILVAILLGNGVSSRATALASYTKMLADGNLPKDLVFAQDETGAVAENLKALTEQLRQLKEFANKIKRGEFTSETPMFYEHSELGEALHEMYEGLNEITIRDMERNRTNEGIALFSSLLREYADAQTLYDSLIKNLVKYLNANQGGIFIIQTTQENEDVLELMSVYAYDRKRYVEKQIRRGQGLVGQIWLEKEMIYMPKVPANYSEIVSGLGSASPRAVLLMPMINNEGQVLGVLELASLQVFEEYEINFVRSVAEMIVSAIASIKSSERTRLLLAEAQRISDKVQAQEENTRQEMQALVSSKQQFANQNLHLQNRFQDFDKSLAIVELDAKGSIFRVNEAMQEIIGYEEEAVFNESFTKFVGERAFQSTAFQHLWQNVLEGIAQNQQMTLYSINNTPLSFWVHFVPLRNEREVVNHVVAICTDITSVQSTLEKAQTRWSSIRQIFYYVEFTPFGIIQEANQTYLRMTGHTLGQIRNQSHTVLLPTNTTQRSQSQEFWHEISQGKAQVGNFYHMTHKGESVQLFGVYYPIFNSQKQIENIVFLAQPLAQPVAV